MVGAWPETSLRGGESLLRKVKNGDGAIAFIEQGIDQTGGTATDVNDRVVLTHTRCVNEVQRHRRVLLEPGDFILGLRGVDVLPMRLALCGIHPPNPP